MRALSATLAAMTAMAFVAGHAEATTLYAADNLTDGSAHAVLAFDPANLSPFAALGVGETVSGVAADSTSVFASLAGGIVKLSPSGAFLGSLGVSGLDQFAALSLAGSVLYAADNL
jgi:hypothetical protein